jgi:excisionase family DNA binding protein
MSEEKLLTVRDVAVLLGVSEKDVLDLAENGTIPAYKVGGVYLRFKSEQIEDFKKKSKMVSHQDRAMKDYTAWDRFRDFIYFNDFYIFAILLIFSMLFFIFRG